MYGMYLLNLRRYLGYLFIVRESHGIFSEQGKKHVVPNQLGQIRILLSYQCSIWKCPHPTPRNRIIKPTISLLDDAPYTY